MRIAQIAPLFESVPPRLYGGTERVVSYLTEELVRQGHQVTLFASADSITSAELVSCIKRALWLDPASTTLFHISCSCGVYGKSAIHPYGVDPKAGRPIFSHPAARSRSQT
jgi:hypothetical protein